MSVQQGGPLLLFLILQRIQDRSEQTLGYSSRLALCMSDLTLQEMCAFKLQSAREARGRKDAFGGSDLLLDRR